MTTFDAHKNFAYSTVATAPSPATSGTSLVVASGEGTRFPAVPFNAVVWPLGQLPTPANAEVVRVTNISTDTFTITRATESSVARSVIIGDQIAAAVTAKGLKDVEDALNALGTASAKNTGTSGNTVPLLDAANTWSGGQTLSPASSIPLALSFSDDGAGLGPLIVMSRISTSPAANDLLGGVYFGRGRDSGGNVTDYGILYCQILDPTDGSEDGSILIQTVVAGAATNVISLANGVQVGAPTGGYKGTGTLNANDVYNDNVALTCPALQKEFIETGTVDLEKWDSLIPDTVIPEQVKREPSALLGNDGLPLMRTVRTPERRFERKHHTAHLFADMLAEGFDPRDPQSYRERLLADSALPGMPTEATWQHNALGTGEIMCRLWLAAEFLALQLIHLQDRVTALEAK